MIRTLTLAGFILTLAMLGASSSGLAQDRLELVEHDVVVFMGGANMLHLQQDGHLEAILTQEFAASRPKFRDLSWEADTVFQQGTVIERWRQNAHFKDLGGLGDLDRQLERLGATVVIAQFGALESMRGEESHAHFTEACEELVDTFQRLGEVDTQVSMGEVDTQVSWWIRGGRSRHSSFLVDKMGDGRSRHSSFLVDKGWERLVVAAWEK